MRGSMTSLSTIWRAGLLLVLTVLLFAGLTNTSQAARYAKLPVVKPINSCADLAKIDISKVADASGAVKSSVMIETEKGPFCKVTSEVAPEILVTAYLPAEHWTQRYYQGRGEDGATGTNGFSMAGTCQPALNGEFVYSVSNVRFTMVTGDKVSSPTWVPDPQKIIDYAYRGNHVAAVISKTLMKAYYGQGPRYSYFIGCSDGGRQGLIEAQRYPDDFDGVAAGSPGILTTAEEASFHLWNYQADRRADGTNILMPEKLKLLHGAVVAQCDTLSGVKDGLLEDPSACHFNPASMKCRADSTDTSSCFTADEVTAIQKLYDGAHDDQGTYFYFGLNRASEELWPLPKTPTAEPSAATTHALQLAYIILPEVTPDLYSDFHRVTFTKAGFERASVRSPLYNAGNTDLRTFAARGGKLILWHGLSDPQIPAAATIAYYQGVQKFMGKEATDGFLRAFMLPGVGHCGGGDGYTEIDVLSALMAWVELKQAPTQIISGKTNERTRPITPQATYQPMPDKPFAMPEPKLTATRPVYPYPYIALYTGKGHPSDDANYTRGTSPANNASGIHYEALKMIGPDNQCNYEIKDGRLVVKNGC